MHCLQPDVTVMYKKKYTASVVYIKSKNETIIMERERDDPTMERKHRNVLPYKTAKTKL